MLIYNNMLAEVPNVPRGILNIFFEILKKKLFLLAYVTIWATQGFPQKMSANIVISLV